MYYEKHEDGVLIRTASWTDLPRLLELSPPEVKNPDEFGAFATIVAEIEEKVVGYAQFNITLDKVMHSQAIRIDRAYKGRGIGYKLCEAREQIARRVGAKVHVYAVAEDGEVALKKILTKLGMTREPVQIWTKSLEG